MCALLSQVLQGKVWVYGVGGLHADVDSAAVKPALIDELDPQYPPRSVQYSLLTIALDSLNTCCDLSGLESDASDCMLGIADLL